MTDFLPWKIPKDQWSAADKLLRAKQTNDQDDWREASLAYQEIDPELSNYCQRMANAMGRRTIKNQIPIEIGELSYERK